MARLAITGLISNLDTDNIISALLEAQKGPARILERKQARENSRLIALQNLNARMLSVAVAARTLSQAQTFRAAQAVSSNSSVLTASAFAGASAGTHRIDVQALAQAQSFASGTFASATDALGLQGQFRLDGQLITVETADSLTTLANAINSKVSSVRASVLQVGTDQHRLVITRRSTGAQATQLFAAGGNNVLQDLGLVTAESDVAYPATNGARGGGLSSDTSAVAALLGLSSPPSGSITLDDGSGPITVTVDLSVDSLQAIATAINNEATLQGSTVAASVVSETSGGFTLYRLEITGAAPVSFTDNNNVLQTLEVLKPRLADEVQRGQDATLSVNGITLSRSSNLISGVIPGVTLFLNSADPGKPVTLSIRPNTEAVTNAVQSFVESYNAARLFIREQTAFNTETLQAGVLLGDSAVLTVERNLFDIAGARVPNILLRDLSELNNGAGVDAGRIRITDRSGATAEVDLTGVTSVQGLINAINARSGISVVASAKATGDGLLLRDTSGGSGRFQVSDVGASTTAADLGLAQSVRGEFIFGAAVTSPGRASLADIGISTNENGTLRLDLGRLNQALSNNPAQVERMFTASGVGIAQVATQKLDFITRTSGGTLSNRTQAIQNVVKDIGERLKAAERRTAMIEERLQRQFAALERALADFQSQSEFLNNQLFNLGNIFATRTRR